MQCPDIEKDEVAAAVAQRVIEKLNLEQVVYETIKEMKVEKEFEQVEQEPMNISREK